MSEEFITAQDGLSLYTKSFGGPYINQPCVLCLSGLVRNSSDYEDFATVLASKGFFVVTMDYRGRGKSEYDKDFNHYRAQYMLNDILSVINAYHIPKAVFVGMSFGGILSMALAALQPNRVMGIIMNDIGPEVGNSGLQRIIDYVGTDRPQSSWDEAVLTLKKMFTTLRFKDDNGWMAMARGTYKEGDDGLLHVAWDTNISKILGMRDSDPDLWKLFGSLQTVPTLSIRGGASDVLAQETFDKMLQIKPDLVRVLVEDVGHCPTFEELVVVKALESFFKPFVLA